MLFLDVSLLHFFVEVFTPQLVCLCFFLLAQSRSYLFLLICLEVVLVVCFLMLLLLSSIQVNALTFAFFIVLFGAGESAIVLSVVVSTIRRDPFDQGASYYTFNSFT